MARLVSAPPDRRAPAVAARTLRTPRPLLATAALAAALAAAGCGCGGSSTGSTDARRTAPRVTVPRTVDPADERAIRGWADTLRRGDVAGAARAFALPSVVSNGSGEQRLSDRAQVRAFNRSLPCGARMTAVEPSAHGFVIATFRLTERPGGDCGDGTGRSARVALRIRDGLISDWIRLDQVPAATPAPGTQA